MATVRILSNRLVLPGGATRRKGDRFDGPTDLLERMVEAETAEWLDGGPEDAAPPEPEPADEAPAPDFASPSAADLAEAEGLSAADFEGAEPSGKTGYTKADVESVLQGQEA